MIGAHRTQEGVSTMRRDEKPLRRVNPGGAVRFVARYTNAYGKRVSAGSFVKKGPCKTPEPEGECCAQHRIWHAYETQKPVKGRVMTVGRYYRGDEPRTGWLDRHPRPLRTEA